jgi:LmbE family N-acetylglucosaminyl deacetylase
MPADAPAIVITHPYEGGHPDHDSACFAVQAACALLRRAGGPCPDLLEITSYHAGPDGDLRVGAFLPGGPAAVTLALTAAQRRTKRRMLDRHQSQRQVLAGFKAEMERLRLAPAYDFLRPPHPGPLWYEQFAWGTDGEGWRQRAAAAVVELGLPSPPWAPPRPLLWAPPKPPSDGRR